MYVYDWDSRVTSITYANGVVTTNTWNATSRLMKVETKKSDSTLIERSSTRTTRQRVPVGQECSLREILIMTNTYIARDFIRRKGEKGLGHGGEEGQGG